MILSGSILSIFYSQCCIVGSDSSNSHVNDDDDDVEVQVHSMDSLRRSVTDVIADVVIDIVTDKGEGSERCQLMP